MYPLPEEWGVRVEYEDGIGYLWVVFLVGAVLGLVVLWWVIRTAVYAGIRDADEHRERRKTVEAG